MNMSFMLTKEQMRDKTKTVTRRVGWWNLKPGAIVTAVEKGMGLKKGETIKKIGLIRIVSVKPEPLKALLDYPNVGFQEVEKEGFGNHHHYRWPTCFVEFFCSTHKKCTPETIVNRIEFEHV